MTTTTGKPQISTNGNGAKPEIVHLFVESIKPPRTTWRTDLDSADIETVTTLVFTVKGLDADKLRALADIALGEVKAEMEIRRLD